MSSGQIRDIPSAGNTTRFIETSFASPLVIHVRPRETRQSKLPPVVCQQLTKCHSLYRGELLRFGNTLTEKLVTSAAVAYVDDHLQRCIDVLLGGTAGRRRLLLSILSDTTTAMTTHGTS